MTAVPPIRITDTPPLERHLSARRRASFFFFHDTATTEIYTTEDTLSLHDALPISTPKAARARAVPHRFALGFALGRSEEHTSELQSPSVISYAVFCLKKKKNENSSPQLTSSIINHNNIQDQLDI